MVVLRAPSIKPKRTHIGANRDLSGTLEHQHQIHPVAIAEPWNNTKEHQVMTARNNRKLTASRHPL